MLETLEKILKVGAGIGLLMYVMGYIVVSRHLASYGINVQQFLQIQYLTAGAWALVMMVIVVGFFVLLSKIVYWMIFEDKKHGLHIRIMAFVIVAAIYTSGAFWMLWGLLAVFFGIDMTIWGTSGVPFSDLFPIIEILAGFMAGFVLEEYFVKDYRARLLAIKPADRYMGPIYVLITIGVFASATSSGLYRHVSAALGGGKPLEVEIVFKESTFAAITGIKLDTTSKTKPCRLLLETDKALYIQPVDSNSLSIALSRETIVAVIVLPTNKSVNKLFEKWWRKPTVMNADSLRNIDTASRKSESTN